MLLLAFKQTSSQLYVASYEVQSLAVKKLWLLLFQLPHFFTTTLNCYLLLLVNALLMRLTDVCSPYLPGLTISFLLYRIQLTV